MCRYMVLDLTIFIKIDLLLYGLYQSNIAFHA